MDNRQRLVQIARKQAMGMIATKVNWPACYLGLIEEFEDIKFDACEARHGIAMELDAAVKLNFAGRANELMLRAELAEAYKTRQSQSQRLEAMRTRKKADAARERSSEKTITALKAEVESVREAARLAGSGVSKTQLRLQKSLVEDIKALRDRMRDTQEELLMSRTEIDRLKRRLMESSAQRDEATMAYTHLKASLGRDKVRAAAREMERHAAFDHDA